MIISDMSYLETADQSDRLEGGTGGSDGGVDFGLNLAKYKLSQLGWVSQATAGPQGAAAGSQVMKMDTSSLSLSGLFLNWSL